MRILIAEDERDLNGILASRLKSEHYSVDSCYDGEEACTYLDSAEYDAVILDVMMPKLDGLSVVKRMRNGNDGTPVLLLTAKDSIEDRVMGLDAGANDYLVKPFAFEELLARIRCLMRRPGKWDDSSLLKLGDITFDPENNRLFKGTKECTLSKREGALMEVFLRNPGQTLTRTVLLNRVWGLDSDVEEGNLDNYIHFLRRRLKSVDSSLVLKTVRGIGYQLEVLLYP